MPTESDVKLTHDDLPWSAPMLIYSSPVVSDSYIDNDGGRKSFELHRRSYNGVTGHKNLESNVIVSYSNDHGRYNTLRDNIPRTVISVVGRLKLGSNKILHIVASDIEWNYIGKSSNVSIDKNVPSQDDFDNQLDDIEEKYAKKKSASNKRIRVNPPIASSSKVPKDDKLSNAQFLEAASQIKSSIPASDKVSDLTKQD
ncbi:2148_t:CDS:1 [Cetraspora pellucida]|uniref:2148_t:CDS:1 n=1 Tax=Cetraspora pellucida TaxID=1433469 RepID=A0ACA9MXJ3_9GLOM|nr:2148_t:CDS:1 [Cetraspora pellucida]